MYISSTKSYMLGYYSDLVYVERKGRIKSSFEDVLYNTLLFLVVILNGILYLDSSPVET